MGAQSPFLLPGSPDPVLLQAGSVVGEARPEPALGITAYASHRLFGLCVKEEQLFRGGLRPVKYFQE